MRLDRLIQVFAGFEPRVLFAYMFGSTGTPSESPRSDLDMAVFFDPAAAWEGLNPRLHLYTELSRAMKRNDIDIVILNTCTNQMLLYEIMIRGRLIYDADSEIRAVFEQKTLHAAIDFKEQQKRIFA